MAKILIGTPIHESKDYAMERFLKSINELEKPCQVDLFLVDNSTQEYADKYGATHIDCENSTAEERIARSREVIRQRVVDEGYDYWFSVENDVILPPGALNEMLRYQEFDIIGHNYPSRYNPNDLTWGFGCTLIKRWCLEKFGFLKEYGNVDPEMPDCWHGGEHWFIKRVRKAGGRYVCFDNLFTCEHLNE